MGNYIQWGPYRIVQPSKEDMMKRALGLMPYVPQSTHYTNDDKVSYAEIEGLLTRLYEVQHKNFSNYVAKGYAVPDGMREMVADESVLPGNLTGSEIIDLGARQPDGAKMKQLASRYGGVVPFYLQNVNAYYLRMNGNEFVHVFTNKAFGVPSEASDVRLYLNLQAENTVEFAKVLMNTCKKVKNEKGMPLMPYYKFSGRHRYDQFIMYVSYENAPYYIQVLEQIKAQRPDLCVGTNAMSEAWGSINGWIGFGENVLPQFKHESYTSLRDDAEYRFKKEVQGLGLKWGDSRIVEIYDRCMQKNGIDPNNYTLNVNSPLQSKVVINSKK